MTLTLELELGFMVFAGVAELSRTRPPTIREEKSSLSLKRKREIGELNLQREREREEGIVTESSRLEGRRRWF